MQIVGAANSRDDVTGSSLGMIWSDSSPRHQRSRCAPQRKVQPETPQRSVLAGEFLAAFSRLLEKSGQSPETAVRIYEIRRTDKQNIGAGPCTVPKSLSDNAPQLGGQRLQSFSFFIYKGVPVVNGTDAPHGVAQHSLGVIARHPCTAH